MDENRNNIKALVKELIREEDGRSSLTYWAGMVLLAPMYCGFQVEDIIKFLVPNFGGGHSKYTAMIRRTYARAVQEGMLIPAEGKWACEWPGLLDPNDPKGHLDFAISLTLDMLTVAGRLRRYHEEGESEWMYEKIGDWKDDESLDKCQPGAISEQKDEDAKAPPATPFDRGGERSGVLGGPSQDDLAKTPGQSATADRKGLDVPVHAEGSDELNP